MIAADMTPHPPHTDDDAVLMVRELTHRFFNALQVIDSSLARLSSAPDVGAGIATARETLAGLARINRWLADGGLLDAGPEEPLADICRALACAFGRTDARIRVSTQCPDLTPRDAQRLVLLAVELVTNVLKHRPGPLSVDVDLRGDGNGGFVLCVSDDGNDRGALVYQPEIATALATGLGATLRVSQGQALAARRGAPAVAAWGGAPGPL